MNAFLRRIVWLIMLVPVIYLAVIWKQVPQTVPLHFDFKGNADKYGSRHYFLVLVLSLTLVNAIIYLLIANIYRIDPKKYAALNKERMQRIAVGVAVYLSAIWIMIIYEVTSNNVSMTMKFIFVAAGLLVAFIGNNMYNIKQNYFAGIRLPWTLENEDNWRKTHQLAGRLWFFVGTCFAVIALLINKNSIAYVGALILAILILIPVLYSYNLYKQSKQIKA